MSVHEETARLFQALEQAAAAWGAEGADDPAAADGGDEPPAHLPTTCGVCPLCLGLARLGRSRPQVLGHLAEAAAALSAAVAALAAEQAGPAPRPPSGADGPGTAPPEPRAQRIDVTD